MSEIEIITHDLLRGWGPCQEGYKRFCELFPKGAGLETALNGLSEDGHDDWAFWLFEKCRDNNIFSEIVLKGYRNSGSRNSGDWNSGDRNSGNWNSGDQNSGDRNSGNWNSGDLNSGDQNSGKWNSGDQNSGGQNSGDQNSGNRNSGDWNSGDWNSGNRNSGFFNTKTPDIVLVFDKPCSRDVWERSYKPAFIFFNLTYWVDESEMSDEDKLKDPNFYVRGGQLRTRSYKDAWKHSWDNADPKDRLRIKELPNFDADLFFEISGIDLR